MIEQVEMLDADSAMAAAALRLAGVRWQPPSPVPFDSGAHVWSQPTTGARVLVARAAARLARTFRLRGLAAPQPAELACWFHVSQDPVNANSLMRGARWAGQQTVGRLPRSRADCRRRWRCSGARRFATCVTGRPEPDDAWAVVDSCRSGVPPHSSSAASKGCRRRGKSTSPQNGRNTAAVGMVCSSRTAPTRCASRWPRSSITTAWLTAGKSSCRTCRSLPAPRLHSIVASVWPWWTSIPRARTSIPCALKKPFFPGNAAIMPVHQFGQPADMTALQAIARRHGLKIIEDAAQAHGAEWESGPAGSLGDAAAFSFQSAKNLACGEGGVLTTNDDAYFERAYSLHNAGRSRALEARWEHVTLGWNVRATEYQAALLLDRLTRSTTSSASGRQLCTFARQPRGDCVVRPLDVIGQCGGTACTCSSCATCRLRAMVCRSINSSGGSR